MFGLLLERLARRRWLSESLTERKGRLALVTCRGVIAIVLASEQGVLGLPKALLRVEVDLLRQQTG